VFTRYTVEQSVSETGIMRQMGAALEVTKAIELPSVPSATAESALFVQPLCATLMVEVFAGAVASSVHCTVVLLACDGPSRSTSRVAHSLALPPLYASMVLGLHPEPAGVFTYMVKSPLHLHFFDAGGGGGLFTGLEGEVPGNIGDGGLLGWVPGDTGDEGGLWGSTGGDSAAGEGLAGKSMTVMILTAGEDTALPTEF